MPLVQVQRSPSPSVVDEAETLELDESRCSSRNRSLSECYYAIRGAAVILPNRFLDNENSPSCSHDSAQCAEIEMHLQMMMRLLRPQDTIKMAVRLQTQVNDHVRYLAVVCTYDVDKRTLLIGMDLYDGQMTIGIVMPLLWFSRVELAADCGVTVHGVSQCCSTADNTILFRPVSLQAMWFVFQSLHKELKTVKSLARRLKEPSPGTEHYMDRISSKDFLCAQWQQSPLDSDEVLDLKVDCVKDFTVSEKALEIRRELRHIMQSVDLDVVTSKDIREQLSKRVDGLESYKEFIDKEILIILGQMDRPSYIFSYLLLGSEWNASNWDELQTNNVSFILNMTREVDNFFPQHFEYRKISVTDEASTQLLSHWNETWQFIKKAKDAGKVCLVHCQKGISRSASTVIAYIMKEYGSSLDQAISFVKKKRHCITPNKGFMDQLRQFDGALEASRYRHAPQFNAHAHRDGHSSRARSVSSSFRQTPEIITNESVRVIVNAFERRRNSTEDRSRIPFPLDVVNKRSSVPQMS